MQYLATPELLLIEDSCDDERLALRAISQSAIACHVTVQRDGLSAINHLLDDDSPEPALIILDYDLPYLKGDEVLSHLRKSEKIRFTPIVVFSGQESEDCLKNCYNSGANSFVAKPSLAEDFQAEVARILEYWLRVNRTI